MLISNTHLGQVITQLDARLAIDRSKFDDDIKSLALLPPSAGKRLEIIGEKGANTKRSYDTRQELKRAERREFIKPLSPSSSASFCNRTALSTDRASECMMTFSFGSIPNDSYASFARGPNLNGSPES